MAPGTFHFSLCVFPCSRMPSPTYRSSDMSVVFFVCAIVCPVRRNFWPSLLAYSSGSTTSTALPSLPPSSLYLPHSSFQKRPSMQSLLSASNALRNASLTSSTGPSSLGRKFYKSCEPTLSNEAAIKDATNHLTELRTACRAVVERNGPLPN